MKGGVKKEVRLTLCKSARSKCLNDSVGLAGSERLIAKSLAACVCSLAKYMLADFMLGY